MKTRLLSPLACAIALTSLPVASWAADPSVSFNVGAVSDYRYRGYSQSRLQPAVQGGMDVTAGAWYLGAWASSIKWVKDGGGDSSIEVDLYGGYKGEVKDAFAYDLGVLTYVYPSNALPTSANTTELYGALTVGPITLKYSHSLTNLFGTANSKNSGYLDLSATFDVAGISVTPHVGRQIVNNSSAASYTDYSLLASKAFGAVTLSAGVVGMNGSKTLYVTPAGKFTGKNMVVAGVKYSF
jgi:uncharacterized protein (TIGR02001 family)